jgi:phosphate transport system substrate-binding protein
MKPLIVSLMILTGCSLLLSAFAPAQPLEETLRISGAGALYPFVEKQADEITDIVTGFKVRISPVDSGRGMADLFDRSADVAMVSRKLSPEETGKGALALCVARDAVVVIINEANPARDALLSRGVSRERLKSIWVGGEIKDWGDLFEGSPRSPIHVYTRPGSSGDAQTWADYLGAEGPSLRGTTVPSASGMVEAVREDPSGIGYASYINVFNTATKTLSPGLRILPVDADGDGSLAPREDIYRGRDALQAAIAGGLCPSPPARELYLVYRRGSLSNAEIVFLSGVVTGERKFVGDLGYAPLSPAEIREQRKAWKRRTTK